MADEPSGAVAVAPGWPAIVYPDGTGMPPGIGRAWRGAVLYAERCADCHGSSGQGARAMELVGDHASLSGEWPDHGIAARWPVLPPLYDYVQRAMPPQDPGSLDDGQTWDLLAHLLVLNRLHPASRPLDRAALLAIRLPNRDGFVDIEAGDGSPWVASPVSPAPKGREASGAGSRSPR